MGNRYLPDVITSILAVIPESEFLLIQQLSGVRNSALYAAPEVMRSWWSRCAAILSEYDNGQPWMDEAFSIFGGKTGPISTAPNLSREE